MNDGKTTFSIIHTTPEFRIFETTVQPSGYYYCPEVFPENLVDIPTDPVEREAFFKKYPACEDSIKPTDTQCFVFSAIQFGLRGKFSYYSVDGTPSAERDFTLKIYSSYGKPWYTLAVEKRPCAIHTTENVYRCIVPVERTIKWDRMPFKYEAGSSGTIDTVQANRVKLVLVIGEMVVDGETVVAPAVVDLTSAKTYSATETTLGAVLWA